MVWGGRYCAEQERTQSRTQPDATPSAKLGILYDVQILAHLKHTNEKLRMNKNIVRIGLAVIAAIYVVVGGLWASDYFPLQKFYAQDKIKDRIIEKVGYKEAYRSKEYDEAYRYEQLYAITHPSIYETEAKLAFYRSLLLWGTIALGAGGGVLFVTRGRKGQATQRDGQLT